MKKILYFAALAMVLLSACDDEITYAEQREKEIKQIATFLKKGCIVMNSDSPTDTLLYVPGGIKTISEKELQKRIKADNDTTSAHVDFQMAANEYVYLEDLEVYMQIVDRGTGDIGTLTRDTLAVGTTRLVNARFVEYNIAGDSIQTSNKFSPSHEQLVDEMCVTYSGSSLSGNFTSGVISTFYGDKNVPNAWLYPLYYIFLGRDSVKPTSRLATVRLIVPSLAGTQDANDRVYPCFYEIDYSAAERISPNACN